MKTRTLMLCALLLCLLAATVVPAAAAPAAAGQKVIILGFDGVDANLTRRWMAEGKLPNLAKLGAEGTFSPLRSTIPSQTPVSWSTFSTGLSPGRHGIFDFLKRNLSDYRPSFAAYDEKTEPFLLGKRNPPAAAALALLVVFLLLFGLLKLFRLRSAVAGGVALGLGLAAAAGAWVAADRLVPKQRPVAINRRQGETFWQALAAAGERVQVVRMPLTFPPVPFPQGELLAGLGTPDVSFRIGKPFYFTSELFFQPAAGGDFSVEVVELVDNRGVIPTEIKGPPNKLFPAGPEYITIPMTLTVAEDRSHLGIEVSGQKLDLKPGEWSDWTHFVFPFNSLVKLHGIGRFRLLSLDPEVRLYLSPIQLDPQNLPPIVDITTPPSFVDELTSRFGLFKTMGWKIDTWSLTEKTIPEEVFMEDVEATVAKEREMLDGLLARDSWDVLFHYFEFTDRVQHMMFRFFDPKHPLYTPEGAAKWGGAILSAYQKMDAIVGDVMERMPKDAILMVVSDHGFASFRRGINYNTWLAQNGYMTLNGQEAQKKNLEDLFDQGNFFTNVDWAHTRAYSLGLGEIYINVAGREAQGIVQPGAEYDALTAELRQKLEAYVDPATGEHPVAHVFTRDEAYGTYDPELIPDLLPSNSEGYRVDWQTALGGFTNDVVEPNTRLWSGDHCSVYPPLVPGVLFSNRPLKTDDPYMADVMPTLLAIYGVPPPTRLDGKSLLP